MNCTTNNFLSHKTFEKVIYDFTEKTNLPCNNIEKCNGLQIEGNFNFAISCFCNIWAF